MGLRGANVGRVFCVKWHENDLIQSEEAIHMQCFFHTSLPSVY